MKPPVCGDGYLDPGEECDDGNLVDDDGCSSECEVEYFERDYACGTGCLETTVISVSVPLLHTNMITYSFNKTTDETCDVSHFVLFDIPNCTDVVNVTSYPPGCATGVNIPCSEAGGEGCAQVGPCRDDWGEFVGRPLKVDISGNECSVTVEFTRNLTFKEDQFGIKGGQACSNCTVLVPDGCYEPPQIFPDFACWWNYGNSTCVAVYNYTLTDTEVAIVPKGPRNFLDPAPLPGTDNTPVVFTSHAQSMGRSAYWNCNIHQTQTWEVDGRVGVASKDSGMVCGDCNNNSIPDPVDIERRTSQDCNMNCIPDECDIAGGTSEDASGNGIPDECEMRGEESQPPTDDPGFDWRIIIVIIAVSICVFVSCCALFFAWGPADCDDEEKDEQRREECERRDPLWADASVAIFPREGRGRGPIGLGMGQHTDTEFSETDGHRKKT